MPPVSRHSGIETIDADECGRLLAQDEVGRVAVIIGETPMIFPVNYALDGDDLVFRTIPGSRLDVGQGHAAFEVDRFDRKMRSGWSVLVTGALEELSSRDVEDMAGVHALSLKSWAPAERKLWLRLRPSFTTGRVIHGDDGGS